MDRSGGGEAQHEEEREEEELVHGGRGLACVELLEGSVKGAECESVRRGGGQYEQWGYPNGNLFGGGGGTARRRACTDRVVVAVA